MSARDAGTRDELELVRRRLVEAEQEYQRARADDYVTRLVRDAAIVDAHRAGLSSREISGLVGAMGQPNVVRARRRAIARREVVPGACCLPPMRCASQAWARGTSCSPCVKVASPPLN